MDHRKIMDVFAYYLSEYDEAAFAVLGYQTQTAGFDDIAARFGKKPSYLRRLRDEYDVVTSSTRNGQRNRPPRSRIIQVQKQLSSYTFDELTEMVKAFLENASSACAETEPTPEEEHQNPPSEMDLEQIINFRDHQATVRIKTSNNRIRVYNTSIISQLKKLYNGQCQICGQRPVNDFDVDICEAHHISYFSESHNNDSSNIIILCPNHHRLLHKLNPSFSAEALAFDFGDGKILTVKTDYHLR